MSSGFPCWIEIYSHFSSRIIFCQEQKPRVSFHHRIKWNVIHLSFSQFPNAFSCMFGPQMFDKKFKIINSQDCGSDGEISSEQHIKWKASNKNKITQTSFISSQLNIFPQISKHLITQHKDKIFCNLRFESFFLDSSGQQTISYIQLPPEIALVSVILVQEYIRRIAYCGFVHKWQLMWFMVEPQLWFLCVRQSFKYANESRMFAVYLFRGYCLLFKYYHVYLDCESYSTIGSRVWLMFSSRLRKWFIQFLVLRRYNFPFRLVFPIQFRVISNKVLSCALTVDRRFASDFRMSAYFNSHHCTMYTVTISGVHCYQNKSAPQLDRWKYVDSYLWGRTIDVSIFIINMNGISCKLQYVATFPSY